MKCTEAGIKGLNLHLGRPGVFGSVFFLDDSSKGLVIRPALWPSSHPRPVRVLKAHSLRTTVHRHSVLACVTAESVCKAIRSAT